MAALRDHHGRPLLSGFASARVLIVDDHHANVALLQRVIRTAGLEGVHAVTDPRDAVRRCLEIDADLVLLDLHMPHRDGYDVLADLQAALPAGTFLPIVVLTGDATIEARDRALAAGATDFLTKPFDQTEVILRVRNLLETRDLHAGMRRHAEALQADLDAREAVERRQAAERQAMTYRIAGALATDAIQTVFQPIVDLRSRQVLGVEALSRFVQEPHRPPNDWFEEAGIIGRGSELELAAVRAALTHVEDIAEEVFLSINLSPAALLDPLLPELLADVPTGRLVIEVTEHAAVDDYDELLRCLEQLRTSGVRIAVDDAGAGFAGLRHILRLRPEILKLDIALTSGIDRDPARRALGTGLVTFAEEIDAVIVAEGIENGDELETLSTLGIPWGQGYHLARPGRLPLDDAVHLDAWQPHALVFDPAGRTGGPASQASRSSTPPR